MTASEIKEFNYVQRLERQERFWLAEIAFQLACIVESLKANVNDETIIFDDEELAAVKGENE